MSVDFCLGCFIKWSAQKCTLVKVALVYSFVTDQLRRIYCFCDFSPPPCLCLQQVRCIAVLSPRETFKTLENENWKRVQNKKLKPQPLLSLESVILAGKREWPRLQVRSDGGLRKDLSWVTKRYVASHFKVMIFLTFFPYYAVSVLMNEWRYRSFVAVKKWRP